MPSQDLILYADAQFASPYAMSVHVALSEKQSPFETRTVGLSAGANHAPAFAATSLTRRVPPLVHQGFALSESSAITEYLDEVFPAMPLYPLDISQRAQARQIQAWLRSDLMPIRMERSTEVVFYGPVGTPLSPAAMAASQKLYAAAEAWLAPGAAHLFYGWCIADLDLAMMLNRLALNDDAVPERLADYAAHQWQRPSERSWLEKPRPPLT